jgi:Fe/S biogenesis protein NfuA
MTDETTEPTPSISLTNAASLKLHEVINHHPNPVAGLRLQILGRTDDGFQHVLSLVEEGAEIDDDTIVEAGEIRVFVETRNNRYLDGVEIDFEEKGPDQSGLEFTNPNPLWFDEREFQIQQLFDEQINPQIASHGGAISLLGVDGRTAYVEFSGGCVGCGMLDVTLKQGVEVALKEQVKDIDDIVDSTDHASGNNPYYKPSKK